MDVREQIRLLYGLIIRKAQRLLGQAGFTESDFQTWCNRAYRIARFGYRSNRTRRIHRSRDYLERMVGSLRSQADHPAELIGF